MATKHCRYVLHCTRSTTYRRNSCCIERRADDAAEAGEVYPKLSRCD